MRSKAIAVVIGFVMLFYGGACQRRPEASVTLAASKNIWSTLPIIAREKGFAKEEGLDLQINYVQMAKLAMDALVGSSTDLALVVEVNVAFLGFTGNTNVGLVSTVVESYDGAIVARKDAGISAPADLRGKSLGILQGTTSQIFAERFLQKHGVPLAEVKVANLQPIAMQTAMVEKGVDAASLWEPFVHNVGQALGANAIVFREPDVYTGYMNVAIRRDWGGRNAETVHAVLRALRKAEQFVRENPAAAQEIVSKEINLDLATTKAIWKLYKFEVTLDPATLLGAIKEEGDWIKRTQQGFADRNLPDYAAYVEPQYLRAVSGTP